MNMRHPSGTYSPGSDKSFGLVFVDLGPDAPGFSRSESLAPILFVLGLLLAVDPAIAKGALERLGIGNCL